MHDRNPLAGAEFFVVADSQAAAAAADSGLRPDQAEALRRLAAQPAAEWFSGGSVETVEQRARHLAGLAAAQGKVLVGVIYNLPNRDCGGNSAGNVTPDEYRAWVLGLIRGVRAAPDLRTVWIYEPDAVAQTLGAQPCIKSDAARQRLALMAETVQAIKLRLPQSLVYMDSCHPGWCSDPKALAVALRSAGVEHADGIAVNVSNFQTTEDSVRFGQQVSDHLDGKHIVVDTSRNGAGPYQGPDVDAADSFLASCNPPGIRPGPAPTTDTGHDRVDAYLYVKRLGESDGSCRPGEPKAGDWMMSHALQALGVG
jgi:endoglucanase